MTTTGTEVPRVEGVRTRTITWTDPARVRFHQRGLDGYGRLETIQRRVFAEGRVVHTSGRVVTTEARVDDDSGTLYSHAKSTCLVRTSA